MLAAEWKLEDALRVREEEGIQKGREEGWQEGRQEEEKRFLNLISQADPLESLKKLFESAPSKNPKVFAKNCKKLLSITRESFTP